jgi:cell division protein FtsB
MRVIVVCLILALIGLQYKLWLGDGSIAQWIQLEEKLHAQEEENKKLSARNRAIEADIVELKSGDQALEEQARFELGMVKDGEVYYHFAE